MTIPNPGGAPAFLYGGRRRGELSLIRPGGGAVRLSGPAHIIFRQGPKGPFFVTGFRFLQFLLLLLY